MTAGSRASGILLLAALAALAGCRSRCAGMEPALEVTVRVGDKDLRAAIKKLTVVAEVSLPGSDGRQSNADQPQTYAVGTELADEQTSFVVRPGPAAAAGFFATVTVTAYGAAGAALAASTLPSQRCTADACNFAKLELGKLAIVDGRPDAPHDIGRETRADLALDGRRDRSDGPTSGCKLSAASTVELKPYCLKKPQWVNVWQYAIEGASGSDCQGPNGQDYPLVGEPSAPFFNYDQCGRSKMYKLSLACPVLVVGTAYCSDKNDCQPFDKIVMQVFYSGDGSNWTAATPPKLDLTKTGSACGAPTNCSKAYSNEQQLALPPTATHLRLTADGPARFQACVYQAAGAP